MEYQKQHKQLVIWLVRSETLATRVMSYDGKITKILQNLLQNNSETVASIHDKEITKKRYIYIYISRRKTENYWKSAINYYSIIV